LEGIIEEKLPGFKKKEAGFLFQLSPRLGGFEEFFSPKAPSCSGNWATFFQYSPFPQPRLGAKLNLGFFLNFFVSPFLAIGGFIF